MTNQTDRMLHITLADGMVRGLVLTARQTVQRAQTIHRSTPVATAALGRALMGTAMLGGTLKEENASVTVTIKGGGPIGRIVCVTDGLTVRGYADEPGVQLPPKPNGKLDVGAAVGKDGLLSVVKDMGLKTPYVGQSPMVSGEIAEDFAAYYVQSEQTPTLQSLGVLVKGDEVLSAGGVLLQPLPGCPDSVIDQLELRSPLFYDLSKEMYQEELESLMEGWFHGLSPNVLSVSPLAYECKCGRGRMERALIALGKKELTRIIEDEIDGAELTCEFCLRRERFTQAQLQKLLDKATERE